MKFPGYTSTKYGEWIVDPGPIIARVISRNEDWGWVGVQFIHAPTGASLCYEDIDDRDLRWAIVADLSVGTETERVRPREQYREIFPSRQLCQRPIEEWPFFSIGNGDPRFIQFNQQQN